MKVLKEEKDWGFTEEEVKEWISDMQQEGIDPFNYDYKNDVKDYIYNALYDRRDATNLWHAVKDYTENKEPFYTVFDAVYYELTTSSKIYKGKYTARTRENVYVEPQVDVNPVSDGYRVTVYGFDDESFEHAKDVANKFKLKTDDVSKVNSPRTEYTKKFSMFIPDTIALKNADEYLAEK